MGTSNSYGGQGGGTPLIPTWIDGGGGETPVPSPPSEENTPVGTNAPVAPVNRNKIQIAPTDRFRSARTNFTKFVKSGGKDIRLLGKSISSYVSTSAGGARNASRRIGSSRRATSNLINFFSSVQSQGSRVVLELLNLKDLVGKSVEDIFLGLADYICPDGGNIDEGIARSAFIETIAELAGNGITDIDSLTSDQMQTVLEIFATHAIEERLCNDIGIKICIASESIADFEKIQAQLHDFILRSVSDAFTMKNINFKSLTSDKTKELVDSVYELVFNILQSLAVEEANK